MDIQSIISRVLKFVDQRRYAFLVFFFFIVFLIFKVFSGASKQPHHDFPVITMAKVEKQTVPLTIQAPGVVESQQIINIRTRVNGLLKKVHFEDGQIVNKGDLLYTIDDDILQSHLKQLKAKLSGDQAKADQAQIELERNTPLVKKGVVTKSRFDELSANAKNLLAVTQADQADIDSANLEIGYTQIVSPITGRISFNKAQTGNFIQISDVAPMATVLQINPIDITFSVSENYLEDLKSKDLSKIKISLSSAEGVPISNKGTLKAIENTVNSINGTIGLKAEFNNDNKALWSGQYVNVTLEIVSEGDSLVIPLPALQTGQSGSFVFVLKPSSQTVTIRPVKAGTTTNSLAVIKEGLKESEFVVTSGQLRLSDGVRVVVQQKTEG